MTSNSIYLNLLTVQELTQTCDVTMKDEYIYIYGGGGGGGGGLRERETYLPRSNPLEELN